MNVPIEGVMMPTLVWVAFFELLVALDDDVVGAASKGDIYITRERKPTWKFIYG